MTGVANNFTGEIKRELVKSGLENACCKTAALSAFLRTTGSAVRIGGQTGFEFVTESEPVAEYMIGLFEELYGEVLTIIHAGADARNGRDRFVFRCLSDRSLYILMELGIAVRTADGFTLQAGIDRYVVENACCKRAYAVGAFLGSGSCTIPEREGARSGYHLEVIFSGRQQAEEFCALLAEQEILAKCLARKGTWIAYLKSRESISDFFALIGAQSALTRLEELASAKDERNQINRVANCMQKNYDKSVLASVRQIRAIEAIARAQGLDKLDEPLRQTAQARLEDKEASFKELAQRLNISKSCLNHRLRKLTQIADELNGGQHGTC